VISFPTSWQFGEARDLCSELVDCINKTAPTVEFKTPYKMIRTTNVKKGRVDLTEAKCVDEATFIKWNRRLTPKYRDIVLTREAPLGDVGLIRTDEKVFLGQRTMLFRANPDLLDQHFLYYTLLGPTAQAQIGTFGSGSTVEHVRVRDAEKITIPYPDLATQRKIAAILTAYDDLIEVNKRRIALLEKMAEELYREWFVRLRFPGYQNARFVKGVPEGWEVVELKDICYEASKNTKAGHHLSDRLYLPLDSLATKKMLPTDHYDYTAAQSSLALFERGDILFGAMRPYQHKVVVAPFKGVTRTTMFVIRPRDSYLHAYTYLNLFQNSSIEYATLICNGVDRPYAVWKRGMERMKVFLPKEEALLKFEKIVGPILENIHEFYFIQRKLAETRDLLLPRLISGKLSVEDLDIQFPPSMQEATAEQESLLEAHRA
jgi:type I restriction enzyme, S subunit